MSDDNNCCNVELTLSESPMVMLDALSDSYIGELPTMSTVRKGGAKVGAGLEVDSDEYLNIAPSGVVGSMIDDGAVTSAKIADGAVTTGKITDGAVTPNKIPDGSVSLAKLSNDVTDILDGTVRAFDTVADMQAATDLEAGMIAHTNGFHASGDGGAAFYTVGTTGTANGMDILALQNSLIATLVINENYVTPEMFGAWGDDTHDDATIYAYIMQTYSGITVNLAGGKTYKIGSRLEVSANDITINGNGATLKGYSNGVIWLGSESHDISFNKTNFVVLTADYPADNTQSYCVATSHDNTDDYRNDGVNRVYFNECLFDGGVFNIAFSNTTGIVIDSCIFGDAWVTSNRTSGGYNVLLQSCYDVVINGNAFNGLAHGRHNVYVSVDQSKTSNKQCENVSITNNYFDHASHLRSSSNSSFIVVRTSVNTSIKNNLFNGGVGVGTNFEDGNIQGLDISNNTFENMVYVSNVSSETKHTINITGSGNYHVYGNISGNYEGESEILSGFVSALHFIGQITDNTTRAKRNIIIDADCNVFVDNFFSRRQSGLVQFLATMPHGFIGNLRCIHSSGWGGAAIAFGSGVTVPLSIITSDLLQYSVSAGGSYGKMARRMLDCTFSNNGSHSYTFTFAWCSDSNLLLDATFEDGIYGYRRTAQSVGSLTITAINISTGSASTGRFVFRPIRSGSVTSDD